MDDKLGRLSILILVVLSILFCLGNLLHHFLVIDSSVFWFYHRTQPAYDDEATLASDVPVSMRERITAKNAHSDYSKCDMHSCFDIKRCSEWSSERNIFQAVSVPTLKGMMSAITSIYITSKPCCHIGRLNFQSVKAFREPFTFFFSFEVIVITLNK